ncbi:hypothetical protein HJG60_011839 [Phyllostomus discolor]|uniref:Uncharacterized protein n=1 Tax=Phyllostomus discolor TaxID=89673 RepID=A0A833ZPH7_9CHIR|nr:hypothetical protein HJG60_011839 [Phyllostomus discolor]
MFLSLSFSLPQINKIFKIMVPKLTFPQEMLSVLKQGSDPPPSKSRYQQDRDVPERDEGGGAGGVGSGGRMGTCFPPGLLQTDVRHPRGQVPEPGGPLKQPPFQVRGGSVLPLRHAPWGSQPSKPSGRQCPPRPSQQRLHSEQVGAQPFPLRSREASAPGMAFLAPTCLSVCLSPCPRPNLTLSNREMEVSTCNSTV